MRKRRMSQHAISLTLNSQNPDGSAVNLWILRLLCKGGLWADVPSNDLYDHDPLPIFYWGLKLRLHLCWAR